MPVHQPPDREDDKDQPEHAADPDGSALTVITATVEPKPTPKENTSSRTIRISSIGLSFIRIVGNPCRATAGSFPVRPIEPAVEQRPKVKVSKDVNYRSGRKHRLTMGIVP